MKCIITTAQVDSNLQSDKIDIGGEATIDGPITLSATITMEVLFTGPIDGLEKEKKADIDSYIAMKLLQLNSITI